MKILLLIWIKETKQIVSGEKYLQY